MPLSAILNKVEDITKRPDARSRALISINGLIQAICNNADYPEDLVETILDNPEPGSYLATISIDLPALPTRRKIEYVVVEGGKPLKSIKPRNALTSEGCAIQDAYYRVGNTLQINSSSPITRIKFGYYQQVGYLSEAGDHWLEGVAETMLIMGTVAAVFRATGDDASAVEYEGQYRIANQHFRRMLADSEEV